MGQTKKECKGDTSGSYSRETGLGASGLSTVSSTVNHFVGLGFIRGSVLNPTYPYTPPAAMSFFDLLFQSLLTPELRV